MMVKANINLKKMALVSFVMVFLVILSPVLVNKHLCFTYMQTLAHWSSKLTPPRTVYIGDSITAGGRSFNGWTSINLGSNGLHTYQINANLNQARKYDPKWIVVMAGTNDAILGTINYESMRDLWRQICSEPRVLITLSPPTRSRVLNARLANITSIAKSECSNRPVVSLNDLADGNGLIAKEYTTDGVHLSKAAYQIWRTRLSEYGI